MTDTGTLGYWYTKPGVPKILDTVGFGESSNLPGDKWRDYMLSRVHHPYHEPKPRWFDKEWLESRSENVALRSPITNRSHTSVREEGIQTAMEYY